MLISIKETSEFIYENKINRNEILNQLKNHLPIESLGILKIDDRHKILKITIKGPKQTPYEDGIFEFEILFENEEIKRNFLFNKGIYEKPIVHILNKIYHLQVEPKSGRICFLMLFDWKHETSIIDLLVMIYLFFILDQNPNSPYGIDKAHLYKSDREEFDRKAREWVLLYANPLTQLKQNDGIDEEKYISVIFISSDQNIHYSVVCKPEDNFRLIEQKLYKEYPEYTRPENIFLVKGNIINKDESIKNNNINNSDIITLTDLN